MKEFLLCWVKRYFSDPQIVILGFLLLFGCLLIYFLGNILAPVLASVVIAYAAFTWFGLQFSMLIAFFVGLSVLLPYVGVIAMFIPVVFIAYFQFGWGPEFTGVVLAYAIIQALDGNLLAPLLLAGVVNIHPVAIITAVILFGGLWGFWGMVFAVPLATLVHAVLKVWFVKKQEFETEIPAECDAAPEGENQQVP